MTTCAPSPRSQSFATGSSEVAPTADPRALGRGLTSAFSGLWRNRIGDYRAVCRIEDDTLVVLVLRVGQRGSVYDRSF
ncbi:MAG: type II toxin-antitoxin system RelE/ParE family toxin [Acidobacteriota bacterium]